MRPLHQHDCKNCIYVGSFDRGSTRFDGYVCLAECQATLSWTGSLIARFGMEGDYWSWPLEDLVDLRPNEKDSDCYEFDHILMRVRDMARKTGALPRLFPAVTPHPGDIFIVYGGGGGALASFTSLEGAEAWIAANSTEWDEEMSVRTLPLNPSESRRDLFRRRWATSC